MPKPPRVAICMPSRENIVSKTTMCLVSVVSDMVVAGIPTAVLNQEGSMISGQRNDLVDRALGMGADYLMWIDADMTFPRDAIIRLLRRGKDIVGASYCRRVPPYESLGALEPIPGGAEPTTGVVKAKYMPGGMMLIKASVYRALPYPWYFETYRPPGNPIESFLAHMRDSFLHKMPEALEEHIRTSEAFGQWIYSEAEAYQDLMGGRRIMSEDYNFCRKATDAGMEIFCDLDLTDQMGHVGDHVVLSRLGPDPAKANATAAA